MTDKVGRVVGGKLDTIVVRQYEEAELEAGDLLIWEGDGFSVIMQVYNMEHGSQMSDRTREMIAGMGPEKEAEKASYYEPDFPDYVLVLAKPLAKVEDGKPFKPKKMPPVYGSVRYVTADDMPFLPGPGANRFLVGHIRSGSSVMGEAGLYMDAAEVFSHHVLVPATTGRGKSNLVKCMMYELIGTNTVGALVLDAHGEYSRALAAHPQARTGLVCYTNEPNPPPGSHPLVVSANTVIPRNLRGPVEMTEAQERMAWEMWRKHGKGWITELLDEDNDTDLPEQQKITRHVLRQKVRNTLGLQKGDVFTIDEAVGDTVADIAQHVQDGKIVVVDTSELDEGVEMMIGNMVASRILWRYKLAKKKKTIKSLPVATVVIEEAPRVLGADHLGSGNPFAEIAKEGRKFKVGVCAITQLSTVIPKEIMANLGTKIIFGNEMQAEREAIIGSAAQDLSKDGHNIASLDKGEAIVSSIFVPFTVPIKVPLFDSLVRDSATPQSKAKMTVY